MMHGKRDSPASRESTDFSRSEEVVEGADWADSGITSVPKGGLGGIGHVLVDTEP